MSESDNEQKARSLALEQAYVHEVYEQCADRTIQGRQWPRIYQFLEELEPGALVCDIGCGNGKYLNVNHNVFKIGVDRCKRFTNIARAKENEVLTCDNLSLPFRDESFDAVLSIAVVHHFSTTERRVHAIKELARILRIGGRLIISVWAMEQKHRMFPSQDVLVPWPKAYISSTGSPLKVRGMYEQRHRNQSTQSYLMSKRQSCKDGRSKELYMNPLESDAGSTSSSLSSPNESCYSFFRNALKKLGRAPWFGQPTKLRSYDEDDVNGWPIELRRLEEKPTVTKIEDKNKSRADEDKQQSQFQQQLSDNLSIKSKSLSNIVDAQRQDLVRSSSSIPGFCNRVQSMEEQQSAHPQAHNMQQQLQRRESGIQSPVAKPRLVKQKKHLLDDSCLGHEDASNSTAIPQIFKDVQADLLQVPSRKGNVHKQSSMNEELMSFERLKECESVRKNIMKQASLNEEFLYKSRPSFGALKESFYSGSATKRFQLLKSDLTNRIKQSTTSIEKVSGISIKNGFVRMLQSWKSTESQARPTTNSTTMPSSSEQQTSSSSSSRCSQSSSCQSTCSSRRSVDNEASLSSERRLSREDGSDSSKDSSLQSDTSVDSEDSLPSVIYIPRSNQSPKLSASGAMMGLPPAPAGVQLSTTSAPPSPRLKYAPEVGGSGMRMKIVSPLLKQQFPATSKSLPPPSPPGLSPHTLNMADTRPFFSGNETQMNLAAEESFLPGDDCRFVKQTETPGSSDVSMAASTPDTQLVNNKAFITTTTSTTTTTTTTPTKVTTRARQQSKEAEQAEPKRPSLQTIRDYRSMSVTVNEDEEPDSEDTATLISNEIDDAVIGLEDKPIRGNSLIGISKSRKSSTTKDESRQSRLNQIKELLSQKPGFATRAKTVGFPIVRRASTSNSGRFEAVTKILPRVLSLDLFNPETDDLDSDSSGVSSPESVGSVISVISDERSISSSKKEASAKSEEKSSDSSKEEEEEEVARAEHKPKENDSDSLIDVSTSPKQKSPIDKLSSKRPISLLDTRVSPVESTWNEECSRQLNDLTDRLQTGSLIHDIDQYCRKTKLDLDDDDPNNLAYPRGRTFTSTCKYEKQQPAETGRTSQRQQPRDNDCCDPDNNSKQQEKERAAEDDGVVVDGSNGQPVSQPIERSCSEESDAGSSSASGFIVVTKNGEFLSEQELRQQQQQQKEQQQQQQQLRPRIGQQRYDNSVESSDIGDSIENTISESSSQAETRRLCSSSTASLASSLATEPRLRLSAQPRSASEEIPSSTRRSNCSASSYLLQRQPGSPSYLRRAHQLARPSAASISNGTLSGSSSQESLPPDQMTYHQYYHVFKSGELDDLIKDYVENLHIISSYYDQSSWCVVAEKVQVWTI